MMALTMTLSWRVRMRMTSLGWRNGIRMRIRDYKSGDTTLA